MPPRQKLKVKVLHEIGDKTVTDEFEHELQDPWMNHGEIQHIAWCAAMKRVKTTIEYEKLN